MKVKLTKGYSYSDGVVFVRSDKPVIEVDGDEGQKLLASGHFEEVEEPAEPDVPDPGEEDEAPDDEEDPGEEDGKTYIVKPVDFDKMTVSQLREYAAEEEIDISGLTKKADIKQRLLEAINSRTPEIFEKY